MEHNSPDHEFRQDGRAARQPTASGSPAHARILVVDDETYIQHVVSLKLSNAGYEVLTASDGEEGLQMAEETMPDLIITDYQMPFLTGLEMCQRLKENRTTADIPVLMLTARGFALDEDDLRSVNILQCLGKPFSPRELVSMVTQALDQHRRSA